ncbi:MAG: hypothetical protein ACP6IP_10700 [Candidatus Njordarchaeia archaeon]
MDSNIVLYAYLKLKDKYLKDEKIRKMKETSRRILEEIENGKLEVLITTVQVREILNILSKKVNIEASILFLGKLLTLKTLG